MVGGGVETTGGREQFSGPLHAHQHFASCVSVVAGGLKNILDGLGGVYGFPSSRPLSLYDIVSKQESKHFLQFFTYYFAFTNITIYYVYFIYYSY